MRTFVYIVTANNDRTLHVGYCKDIKRAVKFYKELPNLHLDIDYNRLVYAEEHDDRDNAIARFNELMGYPRDMKEAVIDCVNPDWIELLPGLNFDLI